MLHAFNSHFNDWFQYLPLPDTPSIALLCSSFKYRIHNHHPPHLLQTSMPFGTIFYVQIEIVPTALGIRAQERSRTRNCALCCVLYGPQYFSYTSLHTLFKPRNFAVLRLFVFANNVVVVALPFVRHPFVRPPQMQFIPPYMKGPAFSVSHSTNFGLHAVFDVALWWSTIHWSPEFEPNHMRILRTG